MRRTQSRQIALPLGPAPIVLAEIACCVCHAMGCSIVAMGRNDNGAIEQCYCSVECGTREGWPWIKGEKARG